MNNEQEFNDAILERISELKKVIATLPPGSVTVKRISGKEYFYHRISNGEKRTETYVSFEKANELKKNIAKRRVFEAELKKLMKQLPRENTPDHKFCTYALTGEALKRRTASVRKYRKRECFGTLNDFVHGDYQNRVFILYGLRRTGKTTLMYQCIADMNPEELSRTAFLQASQKTTLSEMNTDLEYLEEHGYRYVFIDEVTLMEDFIEGAALFSDIYAAGGMKIVLSGTDSLGFVFANSQQLYDRSIMLHTTFIPYRDFENVLGIRGIDSYIRYGGTMSMGGAEYNRTSPFASEKNTAEYIDSSIAGNIQHSLRYYQDGDHFRSLHELYERNELTSAINRCVEDMNHRFTRDVLTRTFRSSDLAVTARNLLHDRTAPIDLNRNIDKDSVTGNLKTMLDILNSNEQSVDITDQHAYEIREYMNLLDLTVDIDVLQLPDISTRRKRTVISQSGMRYAQCEALVQSLLNDRLFNSLSIDDISRVISRVRSEIMGRMMEDSVLLETTLSYPDKHVFILQFAVGEFDMVISDPQDMNCSIFEIKHSAEINESQYRHIADEEKCRMTEYRFGSITGKYVIYRGESTMHDGIQYVNVEEYLRSLPRP